MLPIVSIITPLHNCETFIGKAISSVLTQTYQHWEMIIVDDKSSDKSVEVIEELVKKDSRIKLIRLSENSGAAVARNTALKYAKGRFIAFLDGDDLWLPEKLERQIDFMVRGGYAFTYTAYEKINADGQQIGKVGIPEHVTYYQMLKTCYIGCLTVILDREAFDDINMPLIRRRQDYALWLKLLKKVDKAYGLPEVLGQYRVHDKSISSNKLVTATYTWRMYREIEKLPFFKCCYYFFQYAVRGFLRNKLPRFARVIGVMN